MSYDLTFYVPTHANGPWETTHPFHTPVRLEFLSGATSFISQIFPISGFDAPTVPRHDLPRHFTLQLDDAPEGVTAHRNGERLYYVLAGDVARLSFDTVLPLDEAMLAYIRALPSDYPLIPYVTY